MPFPAARDRSGGAAPSSRSSAPRHQPWSITALRSARQRRVRTVAMAAASRSRRRHHVDDERDCLGSPPRRRHAQGPRRNTVGCNAKTSSTARASSPWQDLCDRPRRGSGPGQRRRRTTFRIRSAYSSSARSRERHVAPRRSVPVTSGPARRREDVVVAYGNARAASSTGARVRDTPKIRTILTARASSPRWRLLSRSGSGSISSTPRPARPGSRAMAVATAWIQRRRAPRAIGNDVDVYRRLRSSCARREARWPGRVPRPPDLRRSRPDCKRCSSHA